MATIPAPQTDWTLGTPAPIGAGQITQGAGAHYYPVSAIAQWNRSGNAQLVVPSPGYSDLVQANPVSYAG